MKWLGIWVLVLWQKLSIILSFICQLLDPSLILGSSVPILLRSVIWAPAPSQLWERARMLKRTQSLAVVMWGSCQFFYFLQHLVIPRASNPSVSKKAQKGSVLEPKAVFIWVRWHCQFYVTGAKPGIYELIVSMLYQFLIDYLAMLELILIILSADTHKNLNSTFCWKKSALF